MSLESTADPKRESWDNYFIRMAKLVSERSKDQSTKVGAVLVKDRRIVATGYNGMPMGINDDVPERHERPHKYRWFEHAERNAIYYAARYGVAVEGCTLYLWPLLPCSDCARAIIQAGIKKVVTGTFFPDEDAYPERWNADAYLAEEMLAEAGISGHIYWNLPL